MRVLKMNIDDPRTTMTRQNIMYEQYLASQQKSVNQNSSVTSGLKKMDLSRSMIDRIVKARPGCGGCGK